MLGFFYCCSLYEMWLTDNSTFYGKFIFQSSWEKELKQSSYSFHFGSFIMHPNALNLMLSLIE